MRTRTPLKRSSRPWMGAALTAERAQRRAPLRTVPGPHTSLPRMQPISRQHLLLTALFLAGILAGTAAAGRISAESAGQMFGQMSDLLTGFVSRRQAQSVLDIFLSSFGVVLVFLIFLFFSGFCAISQPVPALLLLFRGMGYGFSAAGLYLLAGTGGMAYICAVLLPDMFFPSIVLVMASGEAVGLSAVFYGRIQENPGTSLKRAIQLYCLRFAGWAVLLMMITLADACAAYLYLKNASAPF